MTVRGKQGDEGYHNAGLSLGVIEKAGEIQHCNANAIRICAHIVKSSFHHGSDDRCGSFQNHVIDRKNCLFH